MLGLSGKYQSETPGFAGQLVGPIGLDATVSLVNGTAQKQTVATITAVHGGTNAGTFTLTIGVTSPVYGDSTEVVSFVAGAADTSTEVAEGLVAAFNANAILSDVALASNVAGVITLTTLYPRQNPFLSIAGTVSGAGNTLTASPTITSFTEEARIPFGYAVGSYAALGDGQCAKVTTATGLTVVGVAVRSLTEQAAFPYNPDEVSAYPANAPVNILRRGRIWVPVVAAVTKDTTASIVATSGQFTTSGAGTNISGSIYLTSAAAGGIAQVELNLPA